VREWKVRSKEEGEKERQKDVKILNKKEGTYED